MPVLLLKVWSLPASLPPCNWLKGKCHRSRTFHVPVFSHFPNDQRGLSVFAKIDIQLIVLFGTVHPRKDSGGMLKNRIGWRRRFSYLPRCYHGEIANRRKLSITASMKHDHIGASSTAKKERILIQRKRARTTISCAPCCSD